MRKILVFRGGALGDFLVTLPALALLRQRWPEAKIELVGNAPAAALAQSCSLLDAAHSQHEARWAALFRAGPLPPELAAWLAGFDLVVNFWPDPDGALQRRFPLHAGQRFLMASALPEIAPAAAHYCAALAPLGLAAEDYFHRLDVGRGSATPPHIVAVHPGSGSAQKNWPLERWAELCAWLRREHRAELLIVTGEAEPADALAAFGPPARSLPLAELAERLSRCRLFLGHDSGISHLAAACGVPCVLLFGPTDPVTWAPPSPRVRVLRRGAELDAISVAEVQRAVSAALADRT